MIKLIKKISEVHFLNNFTDIFRRLAYEHTSFLLTYGRNLQHQRHTEVKSHTKVTKLLKPDKY